MALRDDLAQAEDLAQRMLRQGNAEEFHKAYKIVENLRNQLYQSRNEHEKR
tara:strand:- start:392 stop:544 length:153 start_codon:yes stop_codon:yes gene_type:complete